jgi:glycine/sarcosine N-methyltransferase
MTEDNYHDFAERYDLFFPTFGKHPPEVRRFFRRVFKQHNVRRVLDCACGTGHDLVLLDSLGCDVAGSDVSPSMLARARKNLRDVGLKIALCRADYRNLPRHFKARFDAVVCLSSSIFEMPNDAEVLEALVSMRGVLRDGGILVLTQGTTDRQWRQKPRFILAADRRDFSRLFVIDYFRRGARYNIIDILHGSPRPEIRVWSIDYPNIVLRDGLERLLGRAGFRKIDFYGTYRLDPYNKKTSNVLIAIACK